jgi:hypothetical protein
LAKINGKPHARRLLHAARIMNQKLPDSGIPIRFNPLGYRSKRRGLHLHLKQQEKINHAFLS